jgi:hypothetical protein
MAANPSLRVDGPDVDPPDPADLRRLFPRAGGAQLRRVAGSARVMVTCGGNAVGIGAFTHCDNELRVTDIGVDAHRQLSGIQVINGILDGLETAAAASGCRRLIVLTSAGLPLATFARRRYRLRDQGCAGCWLEKTL